MQMVLQERKQIRWSSRKNRQEKPLIRGYAKGISPFFLQEVLLEGPAERKVKEFYGRLYAQM